MFKSKEEWEKLSDGGKMRCRDLAENLKNIDRLRKENNKLRERLEKELKQIRQGK